MISFIHLVIIRYIEIIADILNVNQIYVIVNITKIIGIGNIYNNSYNKVYS